MGLIDDIAAKEMQDPEFARAFAQSYQEGIHSAWSVALVSSLPSQNSGSTDAKIPDRYPSSASNSSPKLKQAISAA